MPQRIHSTIDYYCLTLRSSSSELLFRDKEDKLEFKKIIMRFADKYKVVIGEFNLLSHCVNITVESGFEEMSRFVKGVCISYVQHFFNRKYDRSGSLFTPRFVSKTAEQLGGISQAVRRVLRSGVDAGEAKSIKDSFSSYTDTIMAYNMGYDSGGRNTSKLRKSIDIEEFIRLVGIKDKFEVAVTGFGLRVSQIKRHIRRACGIKEVKEFRSLALEIRSEAIKGLREVGTGIDRIAEALEMTREEIKRLLA